MVSTNAYFCTITGHATKHIVIFSGEMAANNVHSTALKTTAPGGTDCETLEK